MRVSHIVSRFISVDRAKYSVKIFPLSIKELSVAAIVFCRILTATIWSLSSYLLFDLIQSCDIHRTNLLDSCTKFAFKRN